MFKHKPSTDRCFLLIGAKRQTIFRSFHLPPGRVGCGRFLSLSQFRASEHRKENNMSKSPSHYAYVVSTPKKAGDKGFWTRIGSVFPHGNAKGFDLVIAENIAVSGRIVCTEPKEAEE